VDVSKRTADLGWEKPVNQYLRQPLRLHHGQDALALGHHQQLPGVLIYGLIELLLKRQYLLRKAPKA
jgi:hypothetical protein